MRWAQKSLTNLAIFSVIHSKLAAEVTFPLTIHAWFLESGRERKSILWKSNGRSRAARRNVLRTFRLIATSRSSRARESGSEDSRLWCVLSVMKTILVTGVSIILGCATIATPAARSQTNSGAGFSHPLKNKSTSANDAESERELQTGTELTRRGQFTEALPHLLAARGKVSNEYAAGFNLALCYVGTRDYKHAIEILSDLARGGHDGADVENLLAQAYIGNGEATEAFAALERASAITPQNEKLYVFVADACADRQDFGLGLRVVELGLRRVPHSPRLHYERAMLLSQLDQFDRAKADFELAARLGQATEIGYLAAAQEALLGGDIANTIKFAREGIRRGSGNPTLLIVLGEALV